jgi:hypothetical protein
MKTDEVPDWETFEQRVKELRAEYRKESSPLLFRGQGDSEWKLTTTLERSGAKGMLFSDYYRLICASIGPEVKALTGVDVPSYEHELCKPFLQASLLFEVGDFFRIDVYQYMAYLRHFGFPSPLLDWSRSPFVASFFAFRDAPDLDGKPEKRSVFVYCESPHGMKTGTVGHPVIRRLGPYLQTHERHFRQRCDYTICGNFDPNYGWQFYSHQAVFDLEPRKQDILWKFNLPSSEREKVLEALSDYNLNAFSLFGSQESLLETMWFREQVLRNAKRLG